jgi:hypothetical protein
LEEATVTNSNNPDVWLSYAFKGVDKDNLNGMTTGS